MKKLMIVFLCLSMAQVAVQAQIKYGLKIGISTPDIKPADIDSVIYKKSSSESLKLKVNDANYGFNIGGWVRLKIGAIYLQPEVIFNTSKVQYKLTRKNGSFMTDSLLSERFNNLDIPILLGFKLGSFRVNGGPIAHIHLNGNNDLEQLTDYKSNFQSATWGYQAGIGLDFGKLGLDLRYEGNFNNFGDHITFGGTKYEFSKASSRLILGIAYSF